MSAVKRKQSGFKEPSNGRPAKTQKFQKSGFTGSHAQRNGNGSGEKKPVMQDMYNATSSKEAHQKQRALAKERRASKPNADSIAQAKKLWERLRRKSHVEKEERQKLVAELFGIITGRVKEFVFKHDSVRTIQCALKYATPAQRKAIAEELRGEYKTLAESRYAKFLVGKVLVKGDTETRDMVVGEFAGSVRRLINHPEASWILDDTYRQICTSRQKAMLLREWYGPEFAIFRTAAPAAENEEPEANLPALIAQNPEKRQPILSYLYQLIDQLVQKKLTGFTMLHDAMLQYHLAIVGDDPTKATTPQATDFVQVIMSDSDEEDSTHDLIKNLAFTSSGSRLISRVLATTGAKDRKTILRAYKDHVDQLACDKNGKNVLLAAYEVVDDTVTMGKMIFPELIGTKTPRGATEIPGEKTTLHGQQLDALMAIALHRIGRVPLVYPFAASQSGPPAKWLIQPGSSEAALIDEVRVLRQSTSKKNPSTRQLELIKALSSAGDGLLIQLIQERVSTLVEDSFGCQYVAEVLLNANSEVVDKTAALETVANLARGDPSSPDHIAHSPSASRLLKTLVQGGKFDERRQVLEKVDGGRGLEFGHLLWEAIREHAVTWATGESSLLVVALTEEDDKGCAQEIFGALKKQKNALQTAAANGNTGAKILQERLM